MEIVRCCWMLVLTSCGFPHGSLSQAAGDGPGAQDDGPAAIDDAPIDQSTQITPKDAPADSIGMGMWTNIATVLPGAPVGDDDPTLTSDLLELYFNRSSDIYVSRRSKVSDPWGAPSLVTELSSASGETTPEITSNGLTIFISSDKAPTTGGEDIWMSTRVSRSAAWSTPVHIDALSS